MVGVVPLLGVGGLRRLGFCGDGGYVMCIKSDAVLGYEAGRWYRIRVVGGGILSVEVGGRRFGIGDIGYIFEHFSIPEPGGLVSGGVINFLRAIESGLGFELRGFQRDAVAALLVRGRGILAFEAGLGKTLSALAFAVGRALLPRFKLLSCGGVVVGVRELASRLFSGEWWGGARVLIVAPQGLVGQWEAEARRFLGLQLRVVRRPVEARGLRGEGSFWAITDYDALSRVGARCERLADVDVLSIGGRVYTSREVCPSCRTDRRRGWDGTGCGRCGYLHIRSRAKATYAHLPSGIDTLILDEVHAVKSDWSARSLAVRGLRARAKLGLSGTPIKERVDDLFWPLWCTVGGGDTFPYGYHDKSRFVSEFCGGGARRGVGRVMKLWRIICANVVSVSLDGCGERLVPYRLEVVRVPFGDDQLEMYLRWLHRFPEYYLSRHPGSGLTMERIVRGGIRLGQGVRLQFACSLPGYQPVWSSTNDTPKNLAVLRRAEELVAAGEQVVIMSNRRMAGPWFAERLRERGVRAAHIVGDDGRTLSPVRREGIIRAFKGGEYRVLCGSTDAMGEGHDLVEASSMIVHAFGWSHSAFVQAIARVRRLTSRRPISVFVYLVEGSIEEEIWERLMEKRRLSNVVLFGSDELQGILDRHMERFSADRFGLKGGTDGRDDGVAEGA